MKSREDDRRIDREIEQIVDQAEGARPSGIVIDGYQGKIALEDATAAEIREEMDRRVIEFRSSGGVPVRRMIAAREIRDLAEVKPQLWDRIPASVRDQILQIAYQVKRAERKMRGASGTRAEAVRVDTSIYRRYHGSDPRGKGDWLFAIGKVDVDLGPEDPAWYRPARTHAVSALPFAKARDYAVAEAKRRGETIVGVSP
jgi:hypothetical protein